MGWGRRRTYGLSDLLDADRRRYAAAHPEIAEQARAAVARLSEEVQRERTAQPERTETASHREE